MIIFTDITKLLQQEEKGFLSGLKKEDELYVFVEKDKSSNMCVPVSLVSSLRETDAFVEFMPLDENTAYQIAYKLGFLTNLDHLPFDGCVVPVTVCLNDEYMKLVAPLKQVFVKSCFEISFVKRMQGKEAIQDKESKPRTARKKTQKMQQAEADMQPECEKEKPQAAEEQDPFREKLQDLLKERGIDPGELLSEILDNPQELAKLKDCIQNSSDANIGLPTLFSVHFGKENSPVLTEVIKNAGYAELKKLVAETK